MNTLPIGTILKGKSYNYQIEKKLGQGTFGITYLAYVKMSGDLGAIDANIKVAIKEFFMRDINGRSDATVTSGSKGGIYDDYKRKFTREAVNLSKLQHPNIIKVIESFEANNTVYYVMEYIGGGSLDDYITKNNGLKEEEAIKIVKQIGSALTFMHNNKMLHLDLKPSNIMMKESGDIVLIDFGLSKQYDSNGEPESSTKVGAGTPGYAPIEQANYREGKGFPVTMDVYALGGTMYKMLTGVRPPEASDILNDGFPLYELQGHSISDSLSACIVKAMAPLKKNRYQTIRDFLDSINTSDNTDSKKFKTRQNKSKTTYTEETEQDEGTDFSESINSTKQTKSYQEKRSPQSNNKSDSRNQVINIDFDTKGKTTKKWWIVGALSVMAAIVFFVFAKSYSNTDKSITPDDTPNMEVIDSIALNMVFIEGSTFSMGRNSGFDWDQKHKVTLSDYYIGKTEITQAQWTAVMGNNPSTFKGNNLPVENVTWADVHSFIVKLNKITGKNYRLPTEAEWEYAAIGGKLGKGYKYSGSDNIEDVAWYKQNSGSSTHAVGTKQPNELGLYDMSGNVNEWCSDWYAAYPSEHQTDPQGGPNDHMGRHIIRGGGWNDNVFTCETTNRTDGGDENKHYNALGIRIACDSDSPNKTIPQPTASTVYSTKDEVAYDGICNGHKWIDLGLPSGIKWAVKNVGASSPKDIGNYYAWGETKTRKSYTEQNDVYYSSKNLSASHDAAAQVMGQDWRIPTKKDLEELIKYCKCENAYDGIVITGRNGHKIYLPFSGSKYGESVSSKSHTCYWTSTPVISNDEFFNESIAITLKIMHDELTVNQLSTFHGLNIRAVTK